VAVLLLLILAPHPNPKTDDAYVTGHYAMIAPRVGGQIASVAVDDNQTVRAGQLLATIDDRDLRTALEQAEANLAVSRARVDQAGAQVARQPAFIDQAAAQVGAARARLALAQADQRRYAALARTGAGTFQQHQQADAQLEQARAALVQAEADLLAQRRQLDALRADRTAALASVTQATAAEHQAKLNLSYTRIVAPIDGTVGQKTVEAGNFVAPGSALMSVVPLDRLYIMANYRELALRHMAPGQSVKIHLDAYDVDLAGIVASLPPSTGATFSPIPPNNATGNFTKIVQRLPVKIVVAPNQPLARLLRAGMSVETTVHTGLADVVGAQAGASDRVTARRRVAQP
jgi:membrane fusion protein (multidrug efflux system)